ncbi:type I secretion system permease/ATPase [Qingshengfaniella alkalisoli]|uniref:Type I secretion system permease/ATPase n=1 Tax=Qingshengfaniella alkalisoli TaxID=2599296 RepID=A0A5B8I986_9RHOB|nr:type I secretion system permease/ATPase [Qingshengfaniella alkalisoli]QDY70785.1 type I secretion system permease/ATPase [Qingshengfaniella alkalisoli]
MRNDLPRPDDAPSGASPYPQSSTQQDRQTQQPSLAFLRRHQDVDGYPAGGANLGKTIESRANEPVTRSGSSGGNGAPPSKFHARQEPERYDHILGNVRRHVAQNLGVVGILTFATNILLLSIPIYLFQISDRVLTSRSIDTLIMLTAIIAGAVVFQSIFDAIRRFILMRTAVVVATELGAPILSAAAHASLHGTGREYQTLGDLQQVRSFLVSGTLISFLDVPFAPLFILAIFLVHPDLGMIVLVTAGLLMMIALANQKATSGQFAAANLAQAKANQHLDSMSRNSQIINALAMIPEAVRIWGRDTAASLTAQIRAQDRNVIFAAVSRAVRLLTQIAILGWGAYLAIHGEITGGMVIAASIIAGRAFSPIEGSIEGWNSFLLTRGALDRVRGLLKSAQNQYEKLRLPNPQGRLDVERLLYVPGGTKRVVLNGINFSLSPGETLAVIGNSGAGKTTLGKMLVGSILPTSGSVRLDLMDIRNWDPRQFGQNIGYLPQDVQLFPGTIKDNIARMRMDATDEDIHEAAVLADVHNMIANLPQGYETVVAADGSPLSGGQKQRIGLARAFFGNPCLLVLDEPNSNLDVAGDKALAKALEHAKSKGITVVVITQKPTLLSFVDKIMLLTDGRVSLFGERETVLTKIHGPKAPTKPVEGPNGETPQ